VIKDILQGIFCPELINYKQAFPQKGLIMSSLTIAGLALMGFMIILAVFAHAGRVQHDIENKSKKPHL
jgi:hypothetical protein